jgi:hypothetical protein
MKLAALVLVAAALGCGSDKICAGVATCYGDQASQCESISGCTAAPVCMTNPTLGEDCAIAATQESCLINFTATDCAWSNGVCSGPCSQAQDPASCASSPWACSWSACSGTPKPCSAYSANSCPASNIGGCSVTTVPNSRLFE